MNHPPVRLILDQSALNAYLAGNLNVAEPIHEVTQDGVLFGTPAVVAAETLAATTNSHDRAALRRLLDLDACAVLATPPGAWLELAYLRQVTGRIDRAAAALAALDHAAPLLTGEGKTYQDHVTVIDFGASA